MARSNDRSRARAAHDPGARRRQRREWRRTFRILALGAATISILLGVGVAPDVMFRDGDPFSALLLVLSPLLLVGAARLIFALVNYTQR